MSYLNPPRLHFAGRFRTDVSTVNNYVTHFENPNVPPDPGWNPKGGATWEVMGCTVTRAVYADGTVARAPSDDAVVGLSLAQIGTARLVDLDPEQQMVSQLWGLQLQLGSAGGSRAFSGAFKTTAFSDIWFNRARVAGGGDFKASAFYQSVLTGVAWDNLLGSRLLTELEQASASGLLSIKFNLDGFDQTTHIGRLVGTIGPAQEEEAAHFVLGRQCMGRFGGPVWFFPAFLDPQRRKLIADFGNALQTIGVGGPFDSTLDLELGMLTGSGQFSSLGKLPIGPAGWYEETAGICEFPSGAALTEAELTQLGSTPIGVRQNGGGSPVAREGVDGLHLRAEDFVYRMSANDTASVSLRASRFGVPLPSADIAVAFDLSELQPGDNNHQVGDPPSGLSFPATLTTDAQGRASLQLTANSIDVPRGYIDGQVYGVRYTIAGSDPSAGGYFDPADFVSVLLWTDYDIPDEPTWTRDVQPILGEYAGLYPVMKPIVDLGNYASVVANKAGLEMVFSLPQENPLYMPVTRDLSPAKRQMILDWLLTTGNAGQPNLDTVPATPVQPPMLVAAALEGAQGDVATLGGKTAAYQRRKGPST